jgi:hypothetical protein
MNYAKTAIFKRVKIKGRKNERKKEKSKIILP